MPTLTQAAVLMGDSALRDKALLAFLRACRIAATDPSVNPATIRKAQVATRILHGGAMFHQAFMVEFWPMILSSGVIDAATSDAAFLTECSLVLDALADVPGPA